MDMKVIAGLAIVIAVIGVVALVQDSSAAYESYVVEDFNASYRTVNSSGYTVYVEENLSSVGLAANILELEVSGEKKYHGLSNVMYQFGNPNLDGGPLQDWSPSLDWRTRSAIEEYDYIKFDGFYYNLSYEGPEDIRSDALRFNAALVDNVAEPGDHATMQLELEVTTDNNVSISTGAPYPFQTLYASNKDNRLCIWSRTYQESEHVGDGYCDGGAMVHAIGLRRTHKPGEIIKRNYSIRSQDVNASGEYVIEENLDFNSRGTAGTVEHQIRFDLTEHSVKEER